MKTRPFTLRQDELTAILSGHQTLLLRPIKPQPPADGRARPFLYDAQGNKSCALGWRTDEDLCGVAVCPFGNAGDLLWIKEKWALECPYEHTDGCGNPEHVRLWQDEIARDSFTVPWRPAITMPRWASRYTLRVLDVRELQVQDITNDNAIDAGVAGENLEDVYSVAGDFLRRCYAGGRYDYLLKCWLRSGAHFSERDSFQTRWDSIYAKRGLGWTANPYVWACRVKVVE